MLLGIKYKTSTYRAKNKKSTRRAKSKKSTSKSSRHVSKIMIQFSVSINNDQHKVEAKDHVAKVVQWYKKHIAFYKKNNKNVKTLTIVHLRNNLFQIICTYTNDDASTIRSELLSMVIDPDHDGNYPLVTNGSSYLVRGKK
jgi:hypothetical protein